MMTLKKTHFLSGIVLFTFVMLHLFNHLSSLWGVENHIKTMNILRGGYRNQIVEFILLSAVCVQIFSGLRLFRLKKAHAASFFDKIQLWSGLYLAIFFLFHVSAIFAGRLFLHLDTNFYFGVAGLNNFPTNLFFIPYYGVAIISFFGHISAIHNKKMKQNILGLTPNRQSKCILAFGIILTFVILYGLTNHFQGVKIPTEYNVLIGK